MNVARRRYLQLFATYVGPEWRRALLLAFLLFSTIGLELANPQLLRRFIDGALAGADIESLVSVALLFMAVAFATQALAALGQYVGEDLGWSATNTLRADLLGHVLGLDMTFPKARTSGELIERIDGDVTALATFFSRFVVNVLGNVVLLAGVVLVVTRESIVAGAAFLLFALGAVGVLTRVRFIAVREWERIRQVSARMYGLVGEPPAGT